MNPAVVFSCESTLLTVGEAPCKVISLNVAEVKILSHLKWCARSGVNTTNGQDERYSSKNVVDIETWYWRFDPWPIYCTIMYYIVICRLAGCCREHCYRWCWGTQIGQAIGNIDKLYWRIEGEASCYDRNSLKYAYIYNIMCIYIYP